MNLRWILLQLNKVSRMYMRKQIGLMLIVLFSTGLLTGCTFGKESADTSLEIKEFYDSDITEGIVDESLTVNLGDIGADDSYTNVICWKTNCGEFSAVKRKYLLKNDPFVDDFIAEYEDCGESKTQIININGNRMINYHLADGNDIYIFEEDEDTSTLVTCVYVNWEDASLYESYDLHIDGTFPDEDNTDYIWERNIDEGINVVSYHSIVEGFTDTGIKSYDDEGRLICWEHYLTSGCRTAFFVWKDDKISMIIDIGGMSYDVDSDDECIGIGEMVYLYKFIDGVSIDDISINNYEF